MKFSDVINDIEKLVGLKLNSIRPGAEITISEVDKEKERIKLKTKSGEDRSRSFQEIKRIWDELCKKPAVHVDSTLAGSGSSRNQPETILANLPYIEYFWYNRLKHIALVGRPTHALGTLKRMDPVQVEEIKSWLLQDTQSEVAHELSMVIVIASDISVASKNLENVTGVPVEPVEPGVYKYSHDGNTILLMAKSSVAPAVTPGTYPVVKGTFIPEGSTSVRIDSRTLYAVCGGGLQLMVAVPGTG